MKRIFTINLIVFASIITLSGQSSNYALIVGNWKSISTNNFKMLDTLIFKRSIDNYKPYEWQFSDTNKLLIVYRSEPRSNQSGPYIAEMGTSKYLWEINGKYLSINQNNSYYHYLINTIDNSTLILLKVDKDFVLNEGKEFISNTNYYLNTPNNSMVFLEMDTIYLTESKALINNPVLTLSNNKEFCYYYNIKIDTSTNIIKNSGELISFTTDRSDKLCGSWSNTDNNCISFIYENNKYTFNIQKKGESIIYTKSNQKQ